MLEHSVANGPGERMVFWFQGCPLGCPGCFNPETHDGAPRRVLPVCALIEAALARRASIEGITVTGGEPFAQPHALEALAAGVRGAGLSVLVFSGYTLCELRRQSHAAACLAHIDVLVAGRYAVKRRLARRLLGSDNL